MILWIVLAAMALGAVALVALPLLRGRAPSMSRAAHEMEIYRDQLDEVGRDLARGLLTPDQAEAARTEIGRRILAIDPAALERVAHERRPVPVRRPTLAIVAAIAVPALATLVYVSQGRPDLPGLPAAERQRAAAGDADGPAAAETAIRARVAALAGALEKDPQDLPRWIALGEALTALQRHAQAAVAYAQAMRLAPDNADFASRHAEALTFADGGQVTPDARAAFEEALRRDPGEPRAQFYLGVADRQGGRLRDALDRWLALEAASPPDAPWLRFLKPRIAGLAEELSLGTTALADLRAAAAERATQPEPGPNPGQERGPTREQIEAARDMSAADRQDMIRGMVDRLAARLEDNPDDADGWLRLARARDVLGEHERAFAAYEKAASLRPADVTVLVAWADSIVAAAQPGGPDAAVLKPVVDRILARDDTHPRGLWLSGALALSAGDTATARTQWTKLLEFVDPNSVQYVELKRQIDALPR